ncbi:MAG TPA: hypothetical protein VFY15_01830 [Acidimicrobiia bacterium]|nr:hypothetical protein [Acidimicrobiia bacterium]
MYRRLLFGTGVLVLSLVAAGCASGTDSGLTGVRDAAEQMYFEVPEEWAVYLSDDLSGSTETPFVNQSAELNLPVFSRVVFHAAGVDAGLPETNTSNVDYPVGAAVVRSIPASMRDQISRYWLAELVLPYHSHPVAQEELKEDISLGEGFDGVKILVLYNDTETETDAAAFLISVTDPEVEFMYSIAIGCSLSCFNEHAQSIIDVVDSWLVNTR